jgi:pilus assembly protein CpaE
MIGAKPSAAKRSPAPKAAQGQFIASIVDEVTRETVKTVAAELGRQIPKIQEGGAEDILRLINTNEPPGILIADISNDEDPIGAMDAIVHLCGFETKIVAIGLINDVALYRRLIDLGASDYLVKPISAQMLSNALRQPARRHGREPLKPKVSRLVAMVGARGGVGATTLAASVAWSLSQELRQKVVLLDLDLHFGSLALSLDIEPQRGLREIFGNPDRIDSLLINAAATTVGDRLRLLAAEEPLEESFEVGQAGLDVLMAELAGDTDVVIADTPRAMSPISRYVLGMADMIGIVTELSLPAMRDTQRLLRLITGLRGKAPVAVIGNRLGGVAGEVGRADFERGIGAKIDFHIPFHLKTALSSVERAKPLAEVARDPKITAELRRLAVALGPSEAAPKASIVQRVLRK